MGTYFDPAVYVPPAGTLSVAEQTCSACGHVNSWCCAPTSSTRGGSIVQQLIPEQGNCSHAPIVGGHFTRKEVTRRLGRVTWTTNELDGQAECDSCAEIGTHGVPAVGHGRNPRYSGYNLCQECIDEYDSRPS